MGSSIAWFSTQVRRTGSSARVSRLSVSYDYGFNERYVPVLFLFIMEYVGVRGMLLILGGVSRSCTWVFYSEDYNTTIQISGKKGGFSVFGG